MKGNIDIIPTRFKEALELNNLRPVDLSLKSGISKVSISQYMHGASIPSNVTAFKLAEALHVNPAWLMGFDVPMGENVKTTAVELDYEVAMKAKEINDDPTARILLDAKRCLTEDELNAVITIINSMMKR